MIDRESAYEELNAKVDERTKEEAEEKAKEAKEKARDAKEKAKAKRKKKTPTRRRSSGRRRKSASDHLMYEIKLVGRQIVRSQGRRILRGILGGMMRR